MNIWMWGYVSVSAMGYSASDFITDSTIMGTGVFCTLLILVGGGLLSKSASAAKNDLDDIDEYGIKWIAGGIILIIAPIIWAIVVAQQWASYLGAFGAYGAIPDFWSVFNPGFGLYGPIIGGCLGVAAGVLSKT
ncbi:MAG: hypothetical protein ACTSPD_21500 [Promethearchaeota archaeon]